MAMYCLKWTVSRREFTEEFPHFMNILSYRGIRYKSIRKKGLYPIPLYPLPETQM